MKSRFHEFFEENNGRLSAARLNAIVATFVVFGVWAIVSLASMELYEFLTIVGLVAAMGGFKLMQKGKETTPSDTNNDQIKDQAINPDKE